MKGDTTIQEGQQSVKCEFDDDENGETVGQSLRLNVRKYLIVDIENFHIEKYLIFDDDENDETVGESLRLNVRKGRKCG